MFITDPGIWQALNKCSDDDNDSDKVKKGAR